MKFEVRGNIYGMEMSPNWTYYPEGLLVLPEDSTLSIDGEMRDEDGTPIDVIVKKSDLWGGWCVLFRNYAVEKCKRYQKYAVLTNEAAALYLGRLILACNRAYQYNWRGINQIIIRGYKLNLDMATTVAFLNLILPATKQNEILFNPEVGADIVVTNPVVLCERAAFVDADGDASKTYGIERKTRSYTRLFMTAYHHHIPGITFFNEDAFMQEVMNFIENGDGGRFDKYETWGPENFSNLVKIAETRLKEIYKRYSSSKVPVEYLDCTNGQGTSCVGMYHRDAVKSEEVKTVNENILKSAK